MPSSPLYAKKSSKEGRRGSLEHTTAVVSLVVSFVAVCIAWRSSIEAHKTTQLERRPWLAAYANTVMIDTVHKVIKARFSVLNYGQAGAANLRVNTVITNRFAGSFYAGKEFDATQDCAPLIPGETTAVTWNVDWPALNVHAETETLYAHICCSYNGVETDGQYYFEQVVALHSFRLEQDGTGLLAVSEHYPKRTYWGDIRRGVVRLYKHASDGVEREEAQ
jgi:hypothetical protein